ncbi:MAG: P-II family nitrogen regulator [Saprospiraceae bacterium]
MKKIEAVIRSSKFTDVREALSEIGIKFFTFMEVKGYGLQKGAHVTYRGAAYDVGYIARLKLEILVEDDHVEKAIGVIVSSGKTGEIGDGKVAVYAVEQLVRIRTGEKAEAAL